jgi:hypothetical protein
VSTFIPWIAHTYGLLPPAGYTAFRENKRKPDRRKNKKNKRDNIENA